MNTYAAIANPAGTADRDRQSPWFWSRKRSGGSGLPAVCLALFLAFGLTTAPTARAAGEGAGLAVLAAEIMNAIIAEQIAFLVDELGFTVEAAECAVFLEIVDEIIAEAHGDCALGTLPGFNFFFSMFPNFKGDGGTVIVGTTELNGGTTTGSLDVAGGAMPPRETRDGETFQCIGIELRSPADGTVVKKLSQDSFQRTSREMGKDVLRSSGIGIEIAGDDQFQGKAMTLTTLQQGPGNQPAALQSTREDLASGQTLPPSFLVAVLNGNAASRAFSGVVRSLSDSSL